MWKSDPWRLWHIGDFFTDLALEIFGGEKTAGSRDSGDIDNWELDVQIEVKGCSNRNSLKIYSKQLDAQVERRGFPFSHLWYAVFFYRNAWWKDSPRSLGNETPTRKTLNAFLNKNTMSLFVVDAKALMAIRDINGFKVEQRTNEVVKTIKMNKKTLSDFVKNPDRTLRHFKLQGFGVFNRRISMKFRGSVADFDLTLILPKKQLRQVLQLNLDFSEKTQIPKAQELFLQT